MTVPRDLQARHLRARAIRNPVRPPPWVAVTGGKGGVGKTLVAVNLAILASRAGYRTLLIDLDPGLANVDVHLRLHADRTVDDVLAGRCSPQEAVLAGPGRLSVLAGRSGSTCLLETDYATLEHGLRDMAAAVSDFDLVVCDTGAGIGAAVMAALHRADVALAVTQSDPSSVTDTYALCKVLHNRGASLPGLVFNRVRSREEAMTCASKLATVCRRFLGREPSLLGWLHEDAGIELSVRRQRPLALHGGGPALEDLRALLASTTSRLVGLRRTGSRDGNDRCLRSKFL